MRKKILITVSGLLFLLILWQIELITYGIRQGLGQWEILRKSVPIEEVLKNSDFPDSLKRKIHLIQKVRDYATEELGLQETDNYTTLYDQKGQTILWNLSACEPFAFEPKTWWFPIVGSVPYKGYFDLERARREEEKLKKAGWDTRIRTVSGWSTLGWFSDPILSNMLFRSEGKLAELIIHELTHATVFVEDKIEFNENLASFIGVQGAIEFLKKEYGDSSSILLNYLSDEEDSRKFTQHLLQGTHHLDTLYISFTEGLSIEEKTRQKNELIQRVINHLDTINFYNSRYTTLFQDGLPNNAYFMSFMRYHSSEDSLKLLLENDHFGNLKNFINVQKATHAK